MLVRGMGARGAALALLCACCCLAPPAAGRVSDAVITRDDRYLILINDGFGFGAEGSVTLTVAGFEHFTKSGAGHSDLEEIGFFITTADVETDLQSVIDEGKCPLKAEQAIKLLTFDLVDKHKSSSQHSELHLTVRLSDVVSNYNGGGLYRIYYSNCLHATTVVSFQLQVALYNKGKDGRRDYLGVGEDVLPALYMSFFVLFSVAGAVWAFTLWRSRAHCNRLHGLMGLLVAAKALTLLSQAGMFHLIRLTGHPEGWNVAFYIFTFLRGLLFFTVIVLVGTGWSYLRPLLHAREKKILMVVIPLQVVSEVMIILLDESTPAAQLWWALRIFVHVVDIACCCAVLFPIVWSIRNLREAAGTDGKAARNLLKLQIFRHFYVMVVCFIYFTRIIVFLLTTSVPYTLAWLPSGAAEAATLAFYIATAVAFRPTPENPYLSLADDEIDLEELRQQTQLT